MTAPARKNIPVYHGDTLDFYIMTDAGVDLSAQTVLFQVRKEGDVIADWSSYVTFPQINKAQFTIPGEPSTAGTAALPRPADECTDVCYYDIQFTSIAGTVKTLLRGQLMVTMDISHG